LENDADILRRYIGDGIEARRSVDPEKIVEVSRILHERLEIGGKLITFGNGGSAADSQHFAAELSGRFLRERRSLPAIALTTNSSSITAIGNDYDYSDVFSRQVDGLCTENDFVVGISTSGNSKNVVRGIEIARGKGAFTLGLTGKSGGRLAQVADECIKVDSDSTPIIQEVHIAIIHMICYTLDGLLK
jgi:D-sedoheptulose 7-phosphate isomerase